MIYVKPGSGLNYPGVDFLREQINRAILATDCKLPVTLDCSRISTVDYTSLKGIDAMITDLRKQNTALNMLHLDESLEKKLKSYSK